MKRYSHPVVHAFSAFGCLMKMMVLLSVALCLVLASTSYASTSYVGTCHSPSYPTISAAVAVAPAGSVVDVCPGSYPEQVFITVSITLQGITNSNGDQATIVVPAGQNGVPNWIFVADPDGGSAMIAPQIYVSNSAVVKINNLTIDSSGETGAPNCNTSGYWHTTAIFLENASGTFDYVATAGQGRNSGCGHGIRSYAGASVTSTLTLSDSSMQDANQFGIILEGAGLTATITKNAIAVTSDNYSIETIDVAGKITSNLVEGLGIPIGDFGSGGPMTFSSNTVRGLAVGTGECSTGMMLSRPVNVTGNTFIGCGTGITIAPSNTGAISLNSNFIANSTAGGIDLGCDANVTLAGNIINNASMGVMDVPASYTVQGIKFENVGMVNGASFCQP